jgi:hypothetical protein
LLYASKSAELKIETNITSFSMSFDDRIPDISKTQQIHKIDETQKDLDWVSFHEDESSSDNDEDIKD